MTRRQGDTKQVSGLRYIGGGAILPGVPARDLSAEEVTLYAAQLEEARQSGTLAMLYEASDKQGEEEVNA